MLTLRELQEKLGQKLWKSPGELVEAINGLGYEAAEIGADRAEIYDPSESDGLRYFLRLRDSNGISIDSLETEGF
jgi:hypothetical protein